MMHLKYNVILELADGTTKDARRTTKRRIASVIRGKEWVDGHLQVRYYLNGAFVGDNISHCTTTEEMLHALDTFTEPELMEFLS